MRKWQAIIFDLDDTLYPEREYVLSGFHSVAKWATDHLHIPKERAFTELKSLYESGVRGNTFNRWLAGNTVLPTGIVSQLVRIYREHIPKLTPFPGIPELLLSLRLSYALGLVSDGDLGMQQRKLQALNLVSYFDAIVFSDEWGRQAWKPSPYPFEVVLRRLGNVRSDEAIYVADNPMKDFLGAHRAGLTTIWGKWSRGEYSHLEPPSDEHRPDMSLETVQELQDLLIVRH